MGNLQNAKDLGYGIATQPELDIVEGKVLSSSTSNVLLSGNLALADYAVTKNFATVTYTGNGSSQSITTGISSVDFTVSGNGSGYYLDRSVNQVKNDAGTVQASGSCVCNVSKVHIKSRSGTNIDHFTFDGIRGVDNFVRTNTTGAEQTTSGLLNSFNSDGITIGTNSVVNGSSETYVAYQTLYTHIKWGTTNQGKFYVEAYNPVTREGMIYYIGSGLAGHEIPHSQGVELDWYVTKGLDDGTTHWQANAFNLRFELDDVDAGSSTLYTSSNSNTWNIDVTNSNWNTTSQEYITYYKAKSETWTIVQYQGTGASGNFVETKDVYGVARKPRRVIIKRTDSTGHWCSHDTERPEDGHPIFLNDSGAEITYADFMDIKTNGFEVGTGTEPSNINWNASGGQYIALVEFDTNGNGGDSYFNLPTDDSNLNLTSGVFSYTNGFGSNGYVRSTESYTGSIDFAGMSDGKKWIAKTEGGSFVAYDKKPMTQMNGDGFSPIFDTNTGKIYTDYALFTDNFNDTSAWIANNVTLSIVDGKLKVYDNGSTAGAKKTFTTIAGKKYKVVTYGVPGNANCQIGLNNGSLDVWQSSFTGYKEAVLTAATTSIDIYLQNAGGASDTYALFEYFSIIPLNNDGTVDVSNATPVSTPISFLPNPVMVASETPMAIDYNDELAQNVLDSIEASGDIKANEFKSKNSCTAWVNFDGTTTPPTIRDSYNVSDVVRTATGVYEIYFETPMDSTNYVTSDQIDSYSSASYDIGGDFSARTVYKHKTLVYKSGSLTNTSCSILFFGGK